LQYPLLFSADVSAMRRCPCVAGARRWYQSIPLSRTVPVELPVAKGFHPVTAKNDTPGSLTSHDLDPALVRIPPVRVL
jgi:hypothetical protein